ncbi:MAG TPA: glycosyltransferase family 4 protein [Tepidisphaeraceae bacterium]|nr:glycosyltransferase family 4 protein [Tepidisphaeraceae bacterium]
MKVLLISHTCQSRAEGQTKADLLGRMDGIQLRVIIPNRWLHYGKWRSADDDAPTGFQADIQPVSWPWMGKAQFYMHWYPRLSRILCEFKPDIIDLWEEPWGLVSFQTCWLRKRVLPSARIISETEQNIGKKLPPPFEQIRSYVLRHADFAIGRSQGAVDILRAKGYAGPAEVVPNGVDGEIFRPMDRASIRDELGIDGFTVGYVGRLVPEKGVIDLVDALKFCPESVRLLFIGDGPLRGELETRGRALGVHNRIRFMPAQPAEKLPPVMNALSVLALPSRTTPSWKEQFGRVIIEAHACGTPVIGADSGAIPDVIGDGGLIVPEASPAALARAIKTLATDPVHCRGLAAAGYKQVRDWCTWPRVAQRMFDIYQSLLSPTSHPFTTRAVTRSHPVLT